MLSALHIKNYILIDSLDIEFPEGLVIISGPTGAGKSILIGAFGLLLGSRADVDQISANADTCVIEGEFDIRDSDIEELCKENDLDYCSGHLTVRRVLSRNGRSRIFVNDEPCPLSVLEQIGKHMVDIHSQHDTLLLKDARYQMSILDAYSGNGDLLVQCSRQYSSVRDLKSRVAELEARIEKARNEADFNAAMFKKLDDAGISEGEIASLEAEQYALGHSEQIKDLLSAAVELFSSESSEDYGGINRLLSELCRKLKELAGFFPEFNEIAERAEQSRIELKDISDEIMSRNESVSCSPERLQWVDDRLSSLYELLKRFSVDDEKQLIRKREDLRKEAFAVEDLCDELSELNKDLSAAELDWKEIAGQLSASRRNHASGFSEEIMKDLNFLELEKARFEVGVTDGKSGPYGYDAVEFKFSSQPSLPLVPIAKCASGGELSRIMLSLKDVMSRFMNLPTMVFDEIDTGVSGSVADKMGRTICRMGDNMQIFAITHLPQVAAKGKAHYLVEKTKNGTAVSKLSAEQRIYEVARMLSGENMTPEALANAKSLIN